MAVLQPTYNIRYFCAENGLYSTFSMNLPKADGPQVLSAFRKHPECTHTPVIVVSSSDAPRDQEQMKSLGVRHYFKKSSNFDEFMKLGAVIKQVLESPLFTD